MQEKIKTESLLSNLEDKGDSLDNKPLSFASYNQEKIDGYEF